MILFVRCNGAKEFIAALRFDVDFLSVFYNDIGILLLNSCVEFATLFT